MTRRTTLLEEILTISRLLKSSLLDSDVEVFLTSLDGKEELLKALAETKKKNTPTDIQLLQEIKILDDENQNLFQDFFSRQQFGRDNNRKEINKIKFTRNLYKKYSIDPLSGSTLDFKE